MPSLRLLCGLVLALLALPAQAQQADRFGDYEIHYNAMPTRMLNAQVAESYNILRSRTRGLLMLTVMQDGNAVPARIRALARDADDRLQEVDMREVRQSAWVSYIGTFPVEDEQALSFEIEVRPQGSDAGPFRLGFRQRFFAGD